MLPQYIIGNEHTLLVRDLAVLLGDCPPNVKLLRQKSAWNNAALTARIIRDLAGCVASLGADVGGFQVVLVLDAAKIHFTPQVLLACRAVGVWLVVVPAGLTWLLQPLDTHAFALYKAHLLGAYQVARTGSADPSGDVDIRAFLACVYATIRKVLQGTRWALAFDRDGFGSRQSALSLRVLRRLECEGPLGAPSSRPSVEQVQLCLPKRAKAAPAAVLSLCDGRMSVTAPMGGAGRPAGLALALVGGAPPAGVPNTRLRCKQSAGAVAVAGPSAAAASIGARAEVAGPVVYGKTRSQTRMLKMASSAAPP